MSMVLKPSPSLSPSPSPLRADVPPISREQYHKLAAVLHTTQAAGHTKVIMIASAVAGEGKTVTAANLALTLSESYHRRVLLVDADLRRPSLHRLLALHEITGLPSEKQMASKQPLHLRQVTKRLGILTPARPSPAPIAELTSEGMSYVIQEARRSYDWIIVDTPPLTLLADASLLVSMVDGVVLVVKAASTTLDLVKRAVQAIDPLKALGVVLNASRRPPHAGYADVDYYKGVSR
jgi:capsular exopolysaccharide synthesis family protein